MVNPNLITDLRSACLIVWAAVAGLICLLAGIALLSGVFS